MKEFHELTFLGQARRLRPLARRVLRRFGIEDCPLRQLTSATNFVFRVDGGVGRRVLRMTSPRSCHTPEVVRSEVEWLRAIAEETDIGVPAPVPTPDGEVVVTASAPDLPASYPCTLFSWVPGHMLADRLSPDNVRWHGELAARLHAHADGFRPSQDFRIRTYRSPFPYSDPDFPVAEPIVVMSRGDLVSPERLAVFEEAHDRVQAVIDDLFAMGAPQVIHNDLHVWNVMVARDRAYALDFEDLLWGFPVQDLATTLFYYRYRDGYDESLASFRSGYESVQSWPEAEPGAIETLIAGRGLLLANFVAASDDAADRSFAPEYLNRVERRLRDDLEQR